MKTLTYISIIILLYSCGNENTSKKDESHDLSPEEKNIDSDTQTNDTALLLEDFSEEIEEEDIYRIHGDFHSFLFKNYDTTSSSITIRGESPFGGEEVCHFEHNFEKGIYYEYKGCQEAGGSETIILPGFSKLEFYQIVNSNFLTEDNTWNEDSTSYEADGAGCYYSIKEKQDSLIVSTYCGC